MGSKNYLDVHRPSQRLGESSIKMSLGSKSTSTVKDLQKLIKITIQSFFQIEL